MVKKGISLEIVAEMTELTIDEIQLILEDADNQIKQLNLTPLGKHRVKRLIPICAGR